MVDVKVNAKVTRRVRRVGERANKIQNGVHDHAFAFLIAAFLAVKVSKVW